MVFAWIAVSYFVFKFLPWWSMVVVALAVGYARPGKLLYDLQLASVSGLVAAVMAFVADGRNSGLISKRMAGLFSLPAPELMWALQFALALVTTWLALQTGGSLQRWRSISQ